MDALTPDRRALRILIRDNELPSCSGQVSLVHIAQPSMHPVTKHLARPAIAYSLPTQRGRLPGHSVTGLDFALHPRARRYARPNRVRRYPRIRTCPGRDPGSGAGSTGCMFASGCSPPHLAATQLLSANGGEHPRERTFTSRVAPAPRRTDAAPVFTGVTRRHDGDGQFTWLCKALIILYRIRILWAGHWMKEKRLLAKKYQGQRVRSCITTV